MIFQNSAEEVQKFEFVFEKIKKETGLNSIEEISESF